MASCNFVSPQFVGLPCGQHGPYTFFKSLKYTHKEEIKKLTLGEFFFVEISPDTPLCIGELQLLWYDKNNPEHQLSSVRLYFRPEDTPEGRLSHHGQDELAAEAEKVVMRASDLLKWIVHEPVTWHYGSQAFSTQQGLQSNDYNSLVQMFATNNCPLKLQSKSNCIQTDATSDKENETKDAVRNGEGCSTSIVILSFPQYCRYRSVLKRLQHCTNAWLKNAVISAIGGFSVDNSDARIMFCRDVFEHPLLEDHIWRQDHLVPLLKGRKRKKILFKKDSESDTNDSEASAIDKCSVSSPGKEPETPTSSVPSPSLKPERNASLSQKNNSKSTESTNVKVLRPSGLTRTSPEEELFLENLFSFMSNHWKPIERLPTLGFREVDLYLFFTLVQKRGGHVKVGQSRLWKHIYDLLGGNPANTSAATCTRRLYEKLLLPYEQYLRCGEKVIPTNTNPDTKVNVKPKVTAVKECKSPSSETHPSNGFPDNGSKTQQKVKHTVQEILNKQHKQTASYSSPPLPVKQEAPSSLAPPPQNSSPHISNKHLSTHTASHFSYPPRELIQRELPHPDTYNTGVSQKVAPPNYVVVSSPNPTVHRNQQSSSQGSHKSGCSGLNSPNSHNPLLTAPSLKGSGDPGRHLDSRHYSQKDAALLPYTRPSVIQHIPNGASSYKGHKMPVDSLCPPHGYGPPFEAHTDRRNNVNKRNYPFVDDNKANVSLNHSRSTDKYNNVSQFPNKPSEDYSTSAKHSRHSTGLPLAKTSDYIDQLRQARRSQKPEPDENCAPLDLSVKAKPPLSPSIPALDGELQETPINLCKKTDPLPTMERDGRHGDMKPYSSMMLPVTISTKQEVPPPSPHHYNRPSPALSEGASEQQHRSPRPPSAHKHPQHPHISKPSASPLINPMSSPLPTTITTPASYVHPAFPGFTSPPGASHTGLLPGHMASQFIYPLMPPPMTTDKNVQPVIPQFLYNPQSAGAFLIPSIPLYTPHPGSLPPSPLHQQPTPSHK